jgi:hypothetical protein
VILRKKDDSIIEGLKSRIDQGVIEEARNRAFLLGKREGFQLAIGLLDHQLGECACRIENEMLIICASCQAEPVISFLVDMEKQLFDR